MADGKCSYFEADLVSVIVYFTSWPHEPEPESKTGINCLFFLQLEPRKFVTHEPKSNLNHNFYKILNLTERKIVLSLNRSVIIKSVSLAPQIYLENWQIPKIRFKKVNQILFRVSAGKKFSCKE